MSIISFKPKKVTKKITSRLTPRAFDVIMNRFGLTSDGEKKTLEEIGKKYKITRERVRQLEDAALSFVKKSDVYKGEQAVFDELKALMYKLGSIVAEHELLPYISKDKETQNHINFFLVLSDIFKKHRKDDHFHTRWSIDNEMTEKVHEALRKLYASLNDEDLMSETEMIKKFFDHLGGLSEQYRDEEIARRWLSISKVVVKNPLGEWGKASSPNIRIRGVRDYAFLVMKRHGTPLHFKEVADSIFRVFNKKIHYATCHNELIKDSRFVLVGRGMYALSEWGYKKGIAREVIANILKREGPLNKEEIIKRVNKERYFKKNTILVNLVNQKYFKRNKDGLYTIV
ncbi:hypothetical protein A2641_02915 [Candidatus Nomurabacteria bacterium RIFCSPHIGHO2_01_FULL_37_25]|uniref:RNA polymerase sigma-70 domain-containing protein n=1 Tax=Candidatus Nomurabacteria bacterium RIFCSPLOWO2_01_FULL_36_16 TaxID=1801767 RepID=A0A1F6X0F3_9BACT|nr:MAG: hypothetical protein A2641_02915 [Candidatus Nomurabacteria bacterium RIFCSPHIGHO2_01_FULL_37_25]OGI75099.1 MAG: hypothetical protein A3D36_03660 [Candidatus Nomurabacteria bacterium RIFCSPHIGHO2_02_FULL_36_29]OGI87610.1 MAG: hypothetical protein A3A91_01735 [Candidatus Nomurabacteria bacterium RIFCSPLOWO2_01_FULL_36_16]OGI97269.1 MAG: hypothetical protein A3I84_01450 [Candidatus Nomurabacteria bacterium RIFCSPLOWO2_02_FULL_36_8]